MLEMLGAKEDFELKMSISHEGIEFGIHGMSPPAFVLADGTMLLETYNSFFDKTLNDLEVELDDDEKYRVMCMLYQSRVKAVRTGFERLCDKLGKDYEKELQKLEEEIFEAEQTVNSEDYDPDKTMESIKKMIAGEED